MLPATEAAAAGTGAAGHVILMVGLVLASSVLLPGVPRYRGGAEVFRSMRSSSSTAYAAAHMYSAGR